MIEGRGKGDNGKKEGEGASQGTCIKDPWAWTAGWGSTVGAGGGGKGDQWGEM